jgi:uncharacterized protein (TIGR02172 family)
MIIFVSMKTYQQINLSEWALVGEGYNGQAYLSDAHPGVMLKLVRRELGAAHHVEKEFNAAKAAAAIGLPTPQVYEIVRDGEDHGYLCQAIEGKKSLARMCADEPDRIPEIAAIMAKYGSALHNTPIPDGVNVADMKSLLLKAVEGSPLLTEAWRERLKALVLAMPETKTCLHGDFQPGNLIMAKGEPYWIDLGWLAQGCYKMDLAHLYKMMVVDSKIPQVQALTHMTEEQMVAFWDAFAKAYTGSRDVDALNRELRPYAALDIVRTFYLHSSDNPDFLAFLKGMMETLLA